MNSENRINNAWNLLHERLQNDELIISSEELKQNKKQKTTVIRLMAYAAVAAILVGGLFLTRQMNVPEIPSPTYLTLENSDATHVSVSTLTDGSTVYLEGETTLQYPEQFEPDKRQVYLTGNAYFDIRNQSGCPFIIHTEQAIVEVVGTSFSIKNYENGPFELKVEEGEVIIKVEQEDIYKHVKTGEHILFSDKELYYGYADTDSFSQFFKKMYFVDQKLSDVLQVINAHSINAPIQASPDVADRKLTFFYEHNEPEQVVQLITEALKLTYSTENNTYYITNP